MRHSTHIVDMGRGNRRRSAFTLVELLVVITIIGMLTALLLPAVQSAREAGRRATCNNNQHQLSIAMQNFESARRFFPGYINNVGTNPYAVGWVVTLFPFMDRKDVYDIWASGETLSAGGTAWPQPGLSVAPMASSVAGTVATTQISVNVDGYKYFPLLDCPSDPPESRNPGDTWCSYVVNRGLNGTAQRLAADFPALPQPAPGALNVPGDAGENGVCMDQFMQVDASGNQLNRPPVRVGVDFISNHDGTSTTLLIAESLLTSRSFFGSAQITTAPISGGSLYLTDYVYSSGSGASSPTTVCYYRPSSLWTSGGYPAIYTAPGAVTTCIDSPSMTAGGVMTITKSYTGSGTLLPCELDLGFEWDCRSANPRITDKVRSRHSGGIVVSFCDGHQHFLTDSINVSVLKQLMTPWGAHVKDPNNSGYSLSGVLDEASY